MEMDPWETLDKEDQAEVYYNHHLRTKSRILQDENMKLKRLLRDNGVSWSPASAAYLKRHHKGRRATRQSVGTAGSSRSSLPGLPVEVLLRILTFALTSKYPIIDPLSALKSENATSVEKARGNQIAIHFLVTCRAMRTEGTRILWNSNTFVFTHPEAVRNFAELDFTFRKNIKQVGFRIIAQFYDDKKRTHHIDRHYHPNLKKQVALPVKQRINEKTYARGGFRCYSWSQIVDFLQALRSPWDPKHDKKQIRPRLLPNLEALRIDLVNFGDDSLPMFGSELHNMSSHELGCTLNELQITGLPVDDAGVKASAELTGLLRDEGLYLTGVPAFVQGKRGLTPLPGTTSCARVVRAWKALHRHKLANDDIMADVHHHHHHHHLESDDEDLDLDGGVLDPHRSYAPIMPAAPLVPGHPTSAPHRKDKTIWRRVPYNRDSETRHWVEFCRNSGYPIENMHGSDDEDEYDDDEMGSCPCCGELHPETLLDILMDGVD